MSVAALTAALERSLLAVEYTLANEDEPMLAIYCEVVRRLLAQATVGARVHLPWRRLVERWKQLGLDLVGTTNIDHEGVEYALGNRLAEGRAMEQFV